MRLAAWAFWMLIASGVYTMLVYPGMMLLLSRVCPRRLRREPIEPPVSLLISALNEEKAMAAKLENSLALDYPAGRLEIIVASDGSTDRTDEIVRSFGSRGVKLLRFDGGLGKSAVINSAVPHCGGEILAFSDATGMWEPSALRKLVAHFADERVGCVSGRVAYSYDGSLAARGFGVYQRFVLALRRAEGAFGAGFNASGSIHAIRRSLFRPGPQDTFMDMVDPLHVAIAGYRTTFEEQAVSLEDTRVRTEEEFKARLRIGLRLWRFFSYALPRLPLLRSPAYCFQVVSHKFLRWLIAPSLVLIFALNLVLLGSGRPYRWTFLGQIAYYAATIAGYGLARVGIRLPGVSALVFFNSTNLAYLVALVQFLSGRRMRQWVPSR